MNEVLDSIKSRRSIRRYKPEMLPQETIVQIIKAGLYASSFNRQQKSLILAVTDRTLKDELSDMVRQIVGWRPVMDPFYGVTGHYVGVGHCILGYPDEATPKAVPRKNVRVIRV